MNTARAHRKTIYIVRHGSTEWNEQGRIMGHQDLDLSALGQQQAEGARSILSPCRLDLALTSPLTRTGHTAKIVLEGRDVTLEEDPCLIELALGGWEGKSRKELRHDHSWHRWISKPHEGGTPEGETLEDVQGRASAALTKGLERIEPGGGLVIVTHGGVARVLLLHLLGLPLAYYHKVRCDCASVSAIEVSPDGELAQVLVLNLTQPLTALRSFTSPPSGAS